MKIPYSSIGLNIIVNNISLSPAEVITIEVALNNFIVYLEKPFDDKNGEKIRKGHLKHIALIQSIMRIGDRR